MTTNHVNYICAIIFQRLQELKCFPCMLNSFNCKFNLLFYVLQNITLLLFMFVFTFYVYGLGSSLLNCYLQVRLVNNC